MHPPIVSNLLLATWQTVYMVFVAMLFAIIGGIILGLSLFLTNQATSGPQRLFNRAFGWLVNITRSIPYIILLILLYPITKFIVGTSIGTTASIVPLAVAALPFYARLAESAFSEVPQGLIEAAQAMGATTWQTIVKVLLPESRPLLIDGATLTTISLIGYSAMAGIVGGGGLGDLTYFKGYNDGHPIFLYGGVIILVILVQCCQSYGQWLRQARRLTSLWLLTGLLGLGIAGQIISTEYHSHHITGTTIKVGYIKSPEQSQIMQKAQQIAKKRYNLHIELISFGDYNIPNRALNDGQLNANIFQHIPFLKNQIQQFGYNIQSIGKTFLYPMGIFSTKIDNLSQLKNGAQVAIPNDPTNRGRALMILEDAGLIKLKPGVQWKATPADITSNPRHLKIVTLQADQIPNNLDTVTLGVINNDYLAKANLTLQDALFIEPKDSPFGNIIVARDHPEKPEALHDLVNVMHSQPVVQITKKLYPGGAAIPAWSNDH